MTLPHADPGPTRGFNPATLTSTLRALSGLTPGDVDTAIGETIGTTRDVERGRLCSCHSQKVLRFLLARTRRGATT